MNDPYKVLGVSRDATDEEIKKAYREMARKYHPDNYANSPLTELAEEKMKEINEAYDQIQKNRASGSDRSYTGDDREFDAGKTYDRIRKLINTGSISEAETLLDIFAISDRGAEWNFLKGCVLLRHGYYYDAQKCFETACYLDPSNTEYRSALDNIRYARTEHRQRNRTEGEQAASECCSCCETLMCMNCCCNCLGGDLFRCC